MKKRTFYFLFVLLNISPLFMQGQEKIVHGSLDAKMANMPEGYYANLYSRVEKVLLKTPIKLKTIEVFIPKDKDLTGLQLEKLASCSAKLLVEEKISLSGDFQKSYL